jgi:hypothetical protein
MADKNDLQALEERLAEHSERLATLRKLRVDVQDELTAALVAEFGGQDTTASQRALRKRRAQIDDQIEAAETLLEEQQALRRAATRVVRQGKRDAAQADRERYRQEFLRIVREVEGLHQQLAAAARRAEAIAEADHEALNVIEGAESEGDLTPAHLHRWVSLRLMVGAFGAAGWNEARAADLADAEDELTTPPDGQTKRAQRLAALYDRFAGQKAT